MLNEYMHIFSCSSTLADRAGRAPQANGVNPMIWILTQQVSGALPSSQTRQKPVPTGCSWTKELVLQGKTKMGVRGAHRASGQRFRDTLHGERKSRIGKGIRGGRGESTHSSMVDVDREEDFHATNWPHNNMFLVVKNVSVWTFKWQKPACQRLRMAVSYLCREQVGPRRSFHWGKPGHGFSNVHCLFMCL